MGYLFHEELEQNMDLFLHSVYDATQHFPKEYQFDITSQLKRAALSVVLNYKEGYARQRKPVMKNFFEISYGSLKEAKYLLFFSYKRNLLTQKEYDRLFLLSENIAKMLWGMLRKMESV